MRITKWHLYLAVSLSAAFVIGGALFPKWYFSKYDVEIDTEVLNYRATPPVSTSSSEHLPTITYVPPAPPEMDFSDDAPVEELAATGNILHRFSSGVTMTKDGAFFDKHGYEITDGRVLAGEITGLWNTEASLISAYNNAGYDGRAAADTIATFVRSLSFEEQLGYLALMADDLETAAHYRRARGFYLPDEGS